MTPLATARDLLLLGARCALCTPLTEASCMHESWKIHAEQWQELRHRMLAIHAEPDEMQQRLRERLALSTAGYWLVMLCASVEIYPEAAAAASILNEQESIQLVTPMTFARLMKTATELPVLEGLQEALDGGRATRLGLIQSEEHRFGKPVTLGPIRLAPQELPAFLSNSVPIGMAAEWNAPVHSPTDSLVFPESIVQEADNLLSRSGLLVIRSVHHRAARQLAYDVCSLNQHPLCTVTVNDATPSWESMGRLRNGWMYIDLFHHVNSTRALPVPELLNLLALGTRVMVGISMTTSSGSWPVVVAPQLGWRESRRVWQAALGQGPQIGTLANRFRIDIEEARDAIAVSSQVCQETIAYQLLNAGALRMGKLVTRLNSKARLDQLVTTANLRHKLREIIVWFQESGRVFSEMGYEQHSGLGRGLICLFSGPSGTGKTFAAQGLANELGLNLYRIDLSQVVSKYIGETEKALSAIFDEAEAGHGILLFDEADSLFGKRSEVKDAHDRYANIEVGYLLQRLESFDGVAILATNMRNNIDSAFLRRIRFLLDFPMPDQAMRRQLWEQALPSAEYRHPLLDLDPFIDRFRVSGGNIQNIGLLAAHLASASPERLLTEAHLARATYRELEKLAQPRGPADFGPLADHLQYELQS